MHSKHLTCGNEKTFPETCQLGVFVRIWHRNNEKNIKKKTPNIGKKAALFKTCLLGVFFSAFYVPKR